MGDTAMRRMGNLGRATRVPEGQNDRSQARPYPTGRIFQAHHFQAFDAWLPSFYPYGTTPLMARIVVYADFATSPYRRIAVPPCRRVAVRRIALPPFIRVPRLIRPVGGVDDVFGRATQLDEPVGQERFAVDPDPRFVGVKNNRDHFMPAS